MPQADFISGAFCQLEYIFVKLFQIMRVARLQHLIRSVLFIIIARTVARQHVFLEAVVQ